MTQQPSIEDQVREAGHVQAQRITWLLERLHITDEERLAFVTLMSQLSVEQIDELAQMLEAKYLDQETQEADDTLRQDLMQVKQTYDAAQQDITDHTMSELDALEKEIDSLT